MSLGALLRDGSAAAQDAAADRAEMDLAAGRILFQNSPLADRIVEVRLPASEPVAQLIPPLAGAKPDNGRRTVRVVLPSPYSDWRDR